MNKLLSLPLCYKKIIANNILLTYHKRYVETNSDMYIHWTNIKEDNGKLFLIKCYQNKLSCICNKETPVNIDKIFQNEYDYVMKLILEHSSDIKSDIFFRIFKK